jgi:predicted Zn finger-like uncharacterized protein
MIVSCPSCQRNYVVPDEQIAGKLFRARCKSCGAEFRLEGTATRDPAGAGSGGRMLGPCMSATERYLSLQSVPPPSNQSVAQPAKIKWSVCFSQTDTRRMTTEEILACLAHGEITSSQFVWKNGMANWVRVSEMPELVSAACKTGSHALTPGALKSMSAVLAAETTGVAGTAKPSVPSCTGQTAPPPPLVVQPGCEPLPSRRAQPLTAPAEPLTGRAGDEPSPGERRTSAVGGVSSQSGLGKRAATMLGLGAPRRPTPPRPLNTHVDMQVSVERTHTKVTLPPLTATENALGTAPVELGRAEERCSTSVFPTALNAEPGVSANIELVGAQATPVHPTPLSETTALTTPVDAARAQASVARAASTPVVTAIATEDGTVNEKYRAVKGGGKRVARAVIGAGVFGVFGVAVGALGAVYVMRSSTGTVPRIAASTVVVLSAQPAALHPTQSLGRTGDVSIGKGLVAAADRGIAGAAPAEPAQRSGGKSKSWGREQPAAPISQATGAAVSRPAARNVQPYAAPNPVLADTKASLSRTGNEQEAESSSPAVAPVSVPAPLDREAALAVLGLAAARVPTCKLADGPTGNAKVYVTFDPNGTVVIANVVGAPIAGTPVAQCVAGIFRRVRVTRFSGERASFTKDVTIP